MSLYLRLVLIVVSLLSFIFVVTNIRKSKVKMDTTFFWVAFSIFVLLLSIFPKIADWGAKMVGIAAPLNFVFLLIIFLLLYKTFTLTIEISRLQQKVEELVQNLAVKDKEDELTE